jgi:hypothetical protein
MKATKTDHISPSARAGRTLPRRLVAGCAAMLLATGIARAQESYTYTNIIDSSGPLKTFDFLLPSINSKGEVVFHAEFPASGGQPAGEGIYVGDASGYRGIAVSGGTYREFFANPAINDDGKVAFQATLTNGGEGVFVGDGKTMGNQTVATSASGRLFQFSLVIRFSDYGLAIDGTGRAVFRAQFQGTNRVGLFSGNGSAQETQLYPPAGSQDQVVDVSPAANSRGDVVFYASTGQLLRTTTTGGPFTVIATTAGDSPFAEFRGSFSINEAGVVAFAARLKSGAFGVYTTDGQSAPQPVVETTTHPQFSAFRSASINNTGSVAFGADFKSGGSNIVVIGPNGGRDVLTSNLFGSTITAFDTDLPPRALNDAGQVVFWYRLANGRQGLAVATPSNGVQPKTLGNISTRLAVSTGENVLIGGLIVTGSENKRVMIRALGPSLADAGVNGALADPVLELFAADGTLIMRNDNWRENQEGEIQATGIAPPRDAESAIVQTLAPGNYTAVLSGRNGTTGVGLVEAYDLNQSPNSKLANISTRGFVDTGDNVLIGGFIVGPYTRTVVRAIGPSLANSGVANALADPTLDVVDGSGNIVATNNNWKDAQQSELTAIGIQPTNDLEAALVTTLQTGNYTAVVRGVNGGTGVGLVEAYNLQ